MNQIKEVDALIISENIKQNGSEVIVCYLTEEMAELSKELSKQQRGKLNLKEIIMEMSHVYYTMSMLRQTLEITDDEINAHIVEAEGRAKVALGITEVKSIEVNKKVEDKVQISQGIARALQRGWGKYHGNQTT